MSTGKAARVLCINGGGVRGLIPAKLIYKITNVTLEITQEDGTKNTTKPQFHELFDYVVGTSIGGLIAVALTATENHEHPKYTPADVVNIIRNESRTIFPSRWIDKFPLLPTIHDLIWPKHSREGIDNLLEAKLGNLRLSDTTIDIATISYSLDKAVPRIWSSFKGRNSQDFNQDFNYFLKDAAGATSAAPTFFAPKVTQWNGKSLHDIDGGIFANSPTHLGIADYKEYSIYSDLIVVSLTTGSFPAESMEYTEPAFNWKVGVSLTVMSLSAHYFFALCKCFTVLTVVASWLVPAAGYALNQFGYIGWGVSHGIADKMMRGSELTDGTTAVKIYDAIRINPVFDQKYYTLDNSDQIFLREFELEIDRTIEAINATMLVECLLGRDKNAESCNNFKEDIKKLYPLEFNYIEYGLMGNVDEI